MFVSRVVIKFQWLQSLQSSWIFLDIIVFLWIVHQYLLVVHVTINMIHIKVHWVVLLYLLAICVTLIYICIMFCTIMGLVQSLMFTSLGEITISYKVHRIPLLRPRIKADSKPPSSSLQILVPFSSFIYYTFSHGIMSMEYASLVCILYISFFQNDISSPLLLVLSFSLVLSLSPGNCLDQVKSKWWCILAICVLLTLDIRGHLLMHHFHPNTPFQPQYRKNPLIIHSTIETLLLQHQFNIVLIKRLKDKL